MSEYSVTMEPLTKSQAYKLVDLNQNGAEIGAVVDGISKEDIKTDFDAVAEKMKISKREASALIKKGIATETKVPLEIHAALQKGYAAFFAVEPDEKEAPSLKLIVFEKPKSVAFMGEYKAMSRTGHEGNVRATIIRPALKGGDAPVRAFWRTVRDYLAEKGVDVIIGA